MFLDYHSFPAPYFNYIYSIHSVLSIFTTLFSHASGYNQDGRAITPGHLFCMASVSKLATSTTAVAIQVSHCTHTPLHLLSRCATLHRLLTHTPGLVEKHRGLASSVLTTGSNLSHQAMQSLAPRCLDPFVRDSVCVREATQGDAGLNLS